MATIKSEQMFFNSEHDTGRLSERPHYIIASWSTTTDSLAITKKYAESESAYNNGRHPAREEVEYYGTDEAKALVRALDQIRHYIFEF